MPNTNSIQTLPVAGMRDQYDPRLHEEASFISNIYPGATYIRVKYLDRSKNRLSLKIGTLIDGQTVKIHLRAYGFDNLYRNLFTRLDSYPAFQELLTQKVS